MKQWQFLAFVIVLLIAGACVFMAGMVNGALFLVLLGMALMSIGAILVSEL